MYHREYPWGKGVWVWQLPECLGGDIDAIIQKCLAYDISYVLIKNGDGAKLWSQLTAEAVQKFQVAGIKVFAWSYVYGRDPVGEAEVAIKCLNLGVNGFVFDAEGEYEQLENNSEAAQDMLEAVRAKHPDKFLAYAPFALIEWHLKFPYTAFGKYCDAVMPQIYYGSWGKTPQAAVLSTTHNFVQSHKAWISNGNADSVKPVIPVAQAYDNYSAVPPYVTKPADIHQFVDLMKGYKSIAFYSFQHIIRDDCWVAIRDAQLDQPTELERAIPAQEEVAEAPVAAVQESPVGTVEVVEEVSEVKQDPVEQAVAPQVYTTIPPVVATESKPQRVELPGTINIPTDSKTTITVKPDASHPDGVKVTVVTHKTHREYFVELVNYLVALIKRNK